MMARGYSLLWLLIFIASSSFLTWSFLSQPKPNGTAKDGRNQIGNYFGKILVNPRPPPPAPSAPTKIKTPAETKKQTKTAPVINESFVVSVFKNEGRVKISWTTNVPADGQVEYGISVNYGSKSELQTLFTTTHVFELGNLAPETTYHFRMLSRDKGGNLGSSRDYTFRTEPANPVAPPPPTPTPPASRIESGVTKKVMVINFDPLVASSNGRRLHEERGWQNPVALEQNYINDIRQASGGYVNYQITNRQDVDGFPAKTDGYLYDYGAYITCLSNHSSCHQPEMADYLKILIDFDVCGKRNRGEIDELWIWGGPEFGYYESRLAGPAAFWYNAPALGGSSCNKQLPIMGFSYERGVSEMIEDLGHRTESVMRQVYGSWEAQPTHAWNRFSLLDKDRPGEAACGNIHFGPNSTADYDWSNTRSVSSSCEDWLNYPNLSGAKEQFNCSRWGCDGYGFKKWWFNHLPRYAGKTDGKWNNWWRYVLDYEGSQ